MTSYIIRRLLLLPLTLFGIILVNFVIINLAPGDPYTITEISDQGQASRRQDRSVAFGSDERYLQMREHFGLTLPVLFNTWSWTSLKEVQSELWTVTYHRESASSTEEMNVKDYDKVRVELGDKARFVMPLLLQIMQNNQEDDHVRRMASRFFARGGSRQAYVGPNITPEQRQQNEAIATDNSFLRGWVISPDDSQEQMFSKISSMRKWYQANKESRQFEPTTAQKWRMLFVDTRFCRYMSRVLTLDFGTLRNDDNKTVISEVTKRFKYSLTLAILPMVITFFLCIGFGFLMASQQGRWPDVILNVLFLILYAIPIFVVAPFLIEKVGLDGHFPFTNIPIPYSGFTSKESLYSEMTSWQRLWDVLRHIFLPVLAILYGGLAAQSRLSRTAVLEVMRQDYVRTARAKGVSPWGILHKHVGRNASITMVTSIAGSLGVILGGSLIVETLFEINGFGKFFYDAVLNWDYNVIMFSALAGSFLALVGYLLADIAYTLLDPRVTLE